MSYLTRAPNSRLQRTSCRPLLLLVSRSACGTKPLNRKPVRPRRAKSCHHHEAKVCFTRRSMFSTSGNPEVTMPRNSRVPNTSLLLVCFTVLGCASTNVPQNSAIDEAKAVVQSHERFARAGDLDGIMSNVAEDIVVLADETPLIKGKAAFRDVYAGYLKAGTFDFRHDYEGAAVVANTVLLHGVARGNFIPPSGQPSPFANNFILVLKRQPDGRFQFWRIAFAPSGRAS